MIKTYEILTKPTAVTIDSEGGPTRVTLSDQFIERCGIPLSEKNRLHQVIVSLDEEIEALPPYEGTVLSSPEEATLLADHISQMIHPPAPRFTVIQGGKK